MYIEQRQGSLEVICGPMFSGKSEELIRRVTRALIAKQRVQVFKPALDDRYAASAVASHSQRRLEALAVQGSADIRRLLDPEAQVVAVDEAQFLDEGLVDLVEALADGGVRVILAGLDQDFAGRPFGIMPALLARAEFVQKLHAICMVCGAAASRSQRLVRSGGQVLVGAAEAYEARCRHCHHGPGEDSPRMVQEG
ncbi:MAG TPA: thymidine kinase [Holophagaceae bacterium]|nr:thymidine kinase [Holophagaceae bacterium]